MENELNLKTKRMDAILAFMDQGVIMFDHDLNIIASNAHAAELCDIPAEMLEVGKNFEQFVKFAADRGDYGTSTSKDVLEKFLALARSGQPHRFERRRPDGRVLEVRGNPTPDGSLVATYTDITDRKKAEEAIARSKQDLDSILENVTDGLVATNELGIIKVFNATAQRIFGYAKEEVIGNNISMLMPEPDQSRHNSYLKTYRDTGQARIIGIGREVVGRRKDGSEFPLKLGIGEVTVGHRRTYIGTVRDMSNRRKVEERTVKIEAQAEWLKEALAKEKELSEMQRQFVAMASHEFRTPLAIIDGAAQRILRRLDRLTPEDVHKRMNKIRRAVARVVTLIDSTLNAARLDTGTIKATFMPCDLSALISQIAKRQLDTAKSHDISVTTSGLPETILADPSLLDQVFTNLLSNAVKYSPADSDIEIRAWGDGKCVVVSFRDEGLGIPASEMPRMFERYFRASTSTGIVGTGIGLNLAKQLVEMHDGSIEVESTEGKGSIFSVRLPIEQNVVQQEEPQASENEMHPTSKPVAGELA